MAGPGSYALIDSKSERRHIIKPVEAMTPTEMNEKETSTYAESWLDAKQRLGFDLSAAQEICLSKQRILLWKVKT